MTFTGACSENSKNYNLYEKLTHPAMPQQILLHKCCILNAMLQMFSAKARTKLRSNYLDL